MQDLNFLRFDRNDPDGVFAKFSRSIYSILESRYERSSTFVDIEVYGNDKNIFLKEELFATRAELRAILICVNGRTRIGAELLIGEYVVRVICNDRHRNDSLPIVNRLKLDMPEVWRREFKPLLSKHQALA